MGVAVLVGLALVGVDSLPKWVEVPTAVVSVQALYGLIMGVVISESSPPYHYPGELSPGDFAFFLYGVILWPPTVLFIAVMATASLLR